MAARGTLTVRTIELDPQPAETLDALHATQPVVADALEDVLDRIEADPPDPRCKRRHFTNGLWAVTRLSAGSEWLVLWEEDPSGEPVIRHIGESTSL